jgi:putative ABC transport system permease protein
MNYFSLFLRKFKKNKLFTLLNLFGLSIGLSAFIYMNSFIQFEKSYENFNINADRVYRVTSQKIQNNEILERKSSAPVILKDHLINNHAEIEMATRVIILETKRIIVRIEDENESFNTYVETRGFQAEKGFFEIFGTPLLLGNPETALDGPNKVILTKSISKKYFGEDNPLGKTITISDDYELDYEVTGLIDDVPLNSHFQYDLLISFDTFIQQRPHWRYEAWDWDYFHTYYLMNEGTDPYELQNKIKESVAKAARSQFEERAYTLDLEFQNLTDIHLKSNLGRELDTNGNGELLYFLKVIAYFILLLAWVNYINLSTAIANLRAKEVGIRKVIGANKLSLTFQYLSEAFIYNLIALLGSYGLIYLISPYLAEVTGFNLKLNQLLSFNEIIFIVSTLAIGTLGSGLYPAFVLSNMAPLRVLKGKYASSKQGLWLRKSLVIFQFTIALILMTMTIGIYQQVNFMRDRELGVDIDQILITNMPNVKGASFWRDFDRFKNQLEDKSYVSKVSTSSEVPGTYLNQVESFKQKGQSTEEAQILKFVWVDYDFFDLYNLELAAGRVFKEESQTDVMDGVMFTEEAIRRLGFTSAEEAIDQPVNWVRNSGEVDPFKVVGVIKDYEQEANNTPQAIIYIMNRRWTSWFVTNYIAIKMNNTIKMESQIADIKNTHNAIYTNDSFDYFFQDDHYNQLYQVDLKFGKIFSFFSLITLLITLLGLFGLTAFIVVGKRKEISVRRVLGADFLSLIKTLSISYVVQIGVAVAVALPASFLMLNSWMNKFIVKMDFGLSLFTAPVIVLVLLTTVILIYHLIQTMKQNPAEVVRE